MVKPINDYLFYECKIVKLKYWAKDNYWKPVTTEEIEIVDCFLDYPEQQLEIMVNKEIKTKIVRTIKFIFLLIFCLIYKKNHKNNKNMPEKCKYLQKFCKIYNFSAKFN